MNNLSKSKITILLGALGLAVLIAAVYLLLLSPRMGKAAEINEQADGVEISNTILTTKVVSLKKQVNELGAKKAESAELNKAFPPTADLDNLFQQVSKAATDAGLSPRSIQSLTQGIPTLVPTGPSAVAGGAPADPTAGIGVTGPATTGVQLATMPFAVNASGTYGQLILFIENLEKMPRAYAVKATNLGSSSATDAKISLALTGSLYVMSPAAAPVVNQDGSVTAAVPLAPVVTTGPGVAPPTPPANTNAVPVPAG